MPEIMRLSLSAALVTALSAIFVPAASAQEITVAGTGGASQAAQRAAWYEPFSKTTGIRIVEDEYDQKLAQIRAQVQTGSVKWDIATVPQLVLKVGCDEGMFERIDWSKVFDPADFSEPISPCGVPAVNSSGVLVYDADRLKDAPKSWADFWNVQRWPGKRGLWYGPQETLEVALMADGVPPDKVDEVLSGPGGADRAFRKLDELKPYIHWWKSGSESIQLLASGETVMTYAWNGRVAAANKDDKRNFKMVWEAGHPNGSSALAILKGSRHKELAVKFIAYATSPEPQAAFAKIITYGPTNKKALPLLDAVTRSRIPGPFMQYAQSQATETYARFWVDNADSLSERFAEWVSR
jgi:putative spermidine/putrescine transport system substrate-binding protein